MKKLKEQGYTVLKGYVNEEWLNFLRVWSNKALEGKEDGLALHAIVNTPDLLNFLNYLESKGLISEIEKEYFGSKFILNSFSLLNNIPSRPNFSAMVHRDIRFFSGNCNLMLNCLVMLDDFTEENGATWVLPGSHLEKELPSAAHWDKHAIQITGKAGDIVLWNSNLFHKAGENKTSANRRGMPIILSKSSMKQLLDYPRAIGYDKKDNFSPIVKQLLGYDSIVPSSLDDWQGERTYKKGQD